jgi:predicted nucleotidyltransferase
MTAVRDIRNPLAAALDRNGVVAALLFGSRARGTNRPGSDVDVGVWADPSLDPGEQLALQLALGSAAEEALPGHEIDVVLLNGAPPALRHRALREGVVLVDRQPATRIGLAASAIVEFLDTQPLRDEIAAGLRHRLAEGRFGRP